MTKERFRKQFETRVILSDAQHAQLRLSQVVQGYAIYRLLERLLLLDSDGAYYMHLR